MKQFVMDKEPVQSGGSRNGWIKECLEICVSVAAKLRNGSQCGIKLCITEQKV